MHEIMLVRLDMKKSTAFRSFLLIVGIVAATMCQAGTYSIVGGPDTSLLAATAAGGGSASWSTSGFSLILNASVNAHVTPPAPSVPSSTASIVGQATWRVRWVESYPGEPHPTTRSVDVNVTPSSGVSAFSASVRASAAHLAGSASSAEITYTSFDEFLPFAHYNVSAENEVDTHTDGGSSTGGSTIWTTTQFNLVSPGTYEADIVDVVNTGLIALASATAPPVPASASSSITIHMKYTIVAVDGQSV